MQTESAVTGQQVTELTGAALLREVEECLERAGRAFALDRIRRIVPPHKADAAAAQFLEQAEEYGPASLRRLLAAKRGMQDMRPCTSQQARQ